MKQFFAIYNKNHVTGIPYNHIAQATIERSNCTLKEILIKQIERIKTLWGRLNSTLFKFTKC